MAELIKNRKAFSGWPMIIGWAGMIIFALHTCTHMVGAGDTWVALACGRHFYNHGVNTVEPFSANSHKAGPTEAEIKTWSETAQWIANKVGIETVRYWHPTGWVNQNWLTHLIFYWLSCKSPIADAASRTFNALVYWKFTIYILTVICVFCTGKILGVNPALNAIFSCFAMFVGRSYIDIRPAGFSNLMVSVFMLILVLTTYKNVLYIWLLMPATVFWCNLHGGYIYAFIMLAPFVGVNFLTMILNKRFISIGRKGLYHTIGCGVATLIATIVFNPFHLTNFTHTLEISISKHAEKWRSINEWHPAFEWDNPVGTAFPFLVMFLLGIGLLLLWLYSEYIYPKYSRVGVKEIGMYKQRAAKTLKVLGHISIALGGWVVFICFSFIPLDVFSFLVCIAFIGIIIVSVRLNVHFIYLLFPIVFLALFWYGSMHYPVELSDKKGYGGAYIYPFIIVPAYVLVQVLISIVEKNCRVLAKNITFVVLTAFACFVVMMATLNPFKIDLAKQGLGVLLDLKRVWRPVYEGSVTLNYGYLFNVLYAVNALAVAVWLAFPYLEKIFRIPKEQMPEIVKGEKYELPRIDLSHIVIAALTIYMAYRSRRFITIAGYVACPILAWLMEQVIRNSCASLNFVRKGICAFTTLPQKIQYRLNLVGLAVVLVFGVWWGAKFKYVYLDPWPNDPDLTSMFMRMTASDVKPFYACDFIRENKLSGNMFNYWTEGGFIAWGQDPDPNTGKTPLQLFMDGRAQAAYNVKDYDIWSEIMYGGPIAESALEQGHQLNQRDYMNMGKWVDGELKKHDVWVVMMPAGQYDTPFMRGLDSSPNWEMAYLDEAQRLYVDISTQKGKDIINGIIPGKTVYPGEFFKQLILAEKMLVYGRGDNEKKLGLDNAMKAFEKRPSIVAMDLIINAGRAQSLSEEVKAFCEKCVDDFIKNREVYLTEDGYRGRIVSAILGCYYLRELSKRGDNERFRYYDDKAEEWRQEKERIEMTKRW